MHTLAPNFKTVEVKYLLINLSKNISGSKFFYTREKTNYKKVLISFTDFARIR
jgi:hypothetical protein